MITSTLDHRRSRRQRSAHRATLTGIAAAAALLLASCAPSAPEETGPEETGPDQTGAPEQTALTVGLTYIPDVQFAPFYLAQDAGYFEAEGLDVTLRHHGASESLFGALDAGQEDVVVAGNDEMVQAVAADVDVRSIATLYRRYPVQIFVPESSDIESVQDLAGRRVGVPGPFGQSWFGLLGYLQDAGLPPEEVQIEHIGFTLFNGLTEGHVDAVAGFVTADAAAFATADFPVRTVADPEVLPLISVGIGAQEQWLAEHPDAAAGLLRAVQHAVDDIVADPERAVEAAEANIPGTMSEQDRRAAHLTAEAMVDLYGTGDIGDQDPQAWAEMTEFMWQMGLLDREVSADEVYTTDDAAGQ